MIDLGKMRKLALSEDNCLSSHWTNCEYDHYPCAIIALCAEIDRLTDMIKELRVIYDEGKQPDVGGYIADGKPR